jgi:tRNA (cytidine/uridine-2'-O-)-methyltransferase
MATIVLVNPQIPQNTGNVVRSCHVTGSKLILVAPLGFSTSDRWLKRSGLDYWEGVDIEIIENLEQVLETTESPFYFFSSKASKTYSDIIYKKDDWLIFGSETNGLPDIYYERWPENFVTIPMRAGSRCLNLATSVGIGLYELQRQVNFSL